MTRYLLRGPHGYVGTSIDWTQHAEDAHWWSSSEEAHRAKRRWLDQHQQQLTVVVRDGNRLTPFTELIYGRP
jgi:hypothetical protein